MPRGSLRSIALGFSHKLGGPINPRSTPEPIGLPAAVPESIYYANDNG